MVVKYQVQLYNTGSTRYYTQSRQKSSVGVIENLEMGDCLLVLEYYIVRHRRRTYKYKVL